MSYLCDRLCKSQPHDLLNSSCSTAFSSHLRNGGYNAARDSVQWLTLKGGAVVHEQRFTDSMALKQAIAGRPQPLSGADRRLFEDHRHKAGNHVGIIEYLTQVSLGVGKVCVELLPDLFHAVG